MVLVDTSVWIEFLKRRQPWHDQVAKLLERNDVLAISPVFGELLQGARNDSERETVAAFWKSLPKAPEEGLFVRAGIESSKNRWHQKGVGLIDSTIITAARETSSFVWTLDKKLDGLLMREERYVAEVR